MQANPDELEVLKIVATRLENAAIPYMVTGSVAANLYAQPRMTRDIDIVIKADISQVHKLHSLFTKDFYVDKDSLEEAIRNRSLFNIIHNEKVVKIDLIVMKEGEYRETEFSRRLKKKVNGLELFIVSPEDLILSKLHWARESYSEMQLGDVRNIISLNSNTLDYDYLRKWAKVLSVSELLDRMPE